MTDESNVPDGLEWLAQFDSDRIAAMSESEFNNYARKRDQICVAHGLPASPVVQSPTVNYMREVPREPRALNSNELWGEPSPAGEKVALPELDVTEEDKRDWLMVLEHLKRRERQLAAALAQLAELKQAAKEFIEAVTASEKLVNNCIQISGLHGFPYTGPNYTERKLGLPPS